MMPGLARELRSLALLLDQGQSLAWCLQRLGSQNQLWLKAASQAEAGAGWSEIARGLPEPMAALIPERDDFPANLRLCADLLDDRQRRLRFWRNVSIYPLLLYLAALALGLFVSLVSRAESSVMGESIGLIRVMLTASNLFLGCLPGLLCLPLLLAALLRRPALRQHVPVLGFLASMQDSVAFFRWLELAHRLQPGLPESIELASRACVLQPLRQGLEKLAEELRSGSSLDRARSGLPPLAGWALLQAEKQQFRPSQVLALVALIERKLEFYREWAGSLLTFGGYLVAGGMALWCSLCVLLPLRNVGNL
ncbi:hypothetical protein JST97_11495 [bacterium]|nr:hypothetical protein [bacterium]